MIEAGGYWRGVESPAPVRIVQNAPLKNLRDCPVCKFGTLVEIGKARVCIDCEERRECEGVKGEGQAVREAA